METETFGMWEHYLPTRIIFGQGRVKEAGKEAKQLGTRALLVTGKASMKRLGVTDMVKESLVGEGLEITIYDEVESNPYTRTIDRGCEIAKNEGCVLIVGLGGGSALDAAKAISIVAAHGGKIWDYVGKTIPGPGLPLMAIPTTAGTGSEVTPWTIFTNAELRWKAGVGSSDTIPKVAIIDPDLMSLMPSDLTASSGVDALTHAIEAYTSSICNYLSDQFALKSIELAARYLVRAVRNKDDVEAFAGMGLASTLAGIAIGHSGVGAAHALGMSIGGFFSTNHGATVGLLLPHVVRYNLSANRERYSRITDILSKEQCGRGRNELAEILESLLQEIALPLKLQDIGVTEETIPDLVEDTMIRQKDDLDTNPKMPTTEDIEQLYRTAF